jgi:alpha-glucosidase
MIQKLDYLQDLGVDALWLSPHYPSPLYDCGYDITDYTGIAPEYGTLEDFKRFLNGAHQRGLRVILDLVLNHTSIEHPWFVQSRSSRQNPYHDWYIWRDGKRDESGRLIPPNNWNSTFGGLAWKLDEHTGQFYYHFFFKEQPDLNWRNPEVKKAMWQAVRYWLDLGVDGFRLDAIGTIFEHPGLPDHPIKLSLADLYRQLRFASTQEEWDEAWQLKERMFQYQLEQPGMHELMQELRTVVDEYDDPVLIGEDDKIPYYGDGSNELSLVFNFPLMRTRRLTPEWVRANQEQRLAALRAISLHAWPCNTLGNHDSSRLISHFGDGINDEHLARISLALMLTLRGTPSLYYGEEIGMTDLILEDIGSFRDQLGLWQYQAEIEEYGTPQDQALQIGAKLSRDRCRTPMQWAGSPNAGFSPAGIITWLPVNPNYRQGINVSEQESSPGSLLNFYKQMLRLRRETPALIDGEYIPVHPEAQDYLAFLRENSSQTCLVLLNMENKAVDVSLPPGLETARLLFSSRLREKDEQYSNQIHLSPFEIHITKSIKQAESA